MELEITPAELDLKLKSLPPVLLDVRTQEEHAWVSLPHSLHIPLHELESRLSELEKFRTSDIVVYCHHGVRSLAATEWLRQQGFGAVSLQGGIDLFSHTVMPTLRRY